MNKVADRIWEFRRVFPGDLNKKRNFYTAYTVLFLLAGLLVFGWIFLSGHTTVWEVDGYSQHLKAYEYWGTYLRNLVRSIFGGEGNGFQEWDFSLGEGSDILQTMQFYVILDPFALIMAVVPHSLSYLAYGALMFVRLYFAGLAFSALCTYTAPKSSRWGILAGSLAYVFGVWSIVNVARHPFFLNPMVFFPLIILGVEKILTEGRTKVFIFGVFLSALSNFYFFYNIVLLTVIYVLTRLIYVYRKELKTLFLKLLQIAGAAILGTAMAAAIVLPTALIFLADSRADMVIPFYLFYDRSYYSSLLGMIFGGENVLWLCVGTVAPGVVATILLLTKRKKHTCLKILLLICLIITLFPVFGQILNGMSYMSNRWSWAYILLSSYILAIMWQDIFQMAKKEIKWIAAILCVCPVLMIFLDGSHSASDLAGLALSILALFVLALGRWKEAKNEAGDVESGSEKKGLYRWKQPFILCITVFHLFTFCWFYYAEVDSETGNKRITELMDANEVKEDLKETEVVRSYAAEDGVTGFYRYSGGFNWNEHTLGGLSNPGYYWSVSNPSNSEFLKKMGITDSVLHQHWGNDNKTALMTTGTVRYIVSQGKVINKPFGFRKAGTYDRNEDVVTLKKNAAEAGLGKSLSEEQKDTLKTTDSDVWNIYRNKYSLPLGYFTKNVIPEETWKDYNFTQRQEGMMQGILLSMDTGIAASYTPEFDSKELEYDIEFDSVDVTKEGNTFTVTKPEATITLKVKNAPATSENYLELRGVDIKLYDEYDLYFGDEEQDPLNLYTKEMWDKLPVNRRDAILEERKEDVDGNSTTLVFKTGNEEALSTEVRRVKIYREKNAWYSGQKDYAVNLGYQREAVETIVMKFPYVGKYTFDSMKVVSYPMNNYVKNVKKLAKYPMENESIETDTVKGTIKAPSDGMLCLAIPYAKGWEAYVDGEKTEIYQANIRYMAVPVKKGQHEIKLEYKTPYLRIGALVSAGSIFVFVAGTVVVAILRRRKKKKAEEA